MLRNNEFKEHLFDCGQGIYCQFHDYGQNRSNYNTEKLENKCKWNSCISAL